MLTIDQRIAILQEASRALSDDILDGYQRRNHHKVETARRALQATSDTLRVLVCESAEWCKAHAEYRCHRRHKRA